MAQRTARLLTVLWFLGAGAASVLGQVEFQPELEFRASDAEEGDLYGERVALSGDVAVIGARWEDRGRGAVYVYRFDGESWVEEQKLLPSDVASAIGTSVCVRDDVILVGAPQNLGAVYVFRFDGSDWIEEQKLTIPFLGENAFGSSLALGTDVAVIGAPGHWLDIEGAVHVFRYDGSTWTATDRIQPGASAPGNHFGTSVGLCDDVIVVGSTPALPFDAPGSVTVFRNDGAGWAETQRLVGEVDTRDNFGGAVSLSGDRLMVGASFEDGVNTSAGAVYVYEDDGSEWIPTQKITQDPARRGAQLGTSIAMEGDLAILGEPNRLDNPGKANVYRYNGSEWVRFQTLTEDEAIYSGFGAWVALSDRATLIGYGQTGWRREYALGFAIPRCLEGTVNASSGSASDALFIDGAAGGQGRTVRLHADEPIPVTVQKPNAGGSGRFALHADVGEPNLDRAAILPFDVGTTCFPFLLIRGAAPIVVANNLGRTGLFGESNFLGDPREDPEPATTTLVYPALPVGTVLTFQAIVADPASAGSRGLSTTNAVVLRVIP